MLPLSQNEGALMLQDFRSAAAAKPIDSAGIETQNDRREQIVTVLGASLAVLIVGASAVLLGMA